MDDVIDNHTPIRPPTQDGTAPVLPRAVALAPAEAVPDHVEFEDTGEVVTRLSSMMQSQPGDDTPQLTPEALIRELMKHAVAKVEGGNSGGDGPPPSKKFLGQDARGWGGWMLKYILAGAAAIFAWYTWVNNSIEDRPTFDEAAHIADVAAEKAALSMDSVVDDHTVHEVHPATQKVLDAHAAQLKKLGDNQIEQTTILKGQAESLKDIKQDLRYLSGRSRRSRDHDDD